MSEIITKGFWVPAQLDMLAEFYPDHHIDDLVQMIGRGVDSIYNKAFALGIKKTDEYLASPKACRLMREQTPAMIANRFKKGQTPPNKGKKQTEYMTKTAIDRTKKTRFTKGSQPKNYRPVGSIRVVDGYFEMKMAEGMRRWKSLNRVIWERLNGPIPKGMIVKMLDGNKQNIEITNMSLFTRAQNMAANTLHRFPKEIAELIQLQGAINRQINKRAKNEQH